MVALAVLALGLLAGSGSRDVQQVARKLVDRRGVTDITHEGARGAAELPLIEAQVVAVRLVEGRGEVVDVLIPASRSGRGKF